MKKIKKESPYEALAVDRSTALRAREAKRATGIPIKLLFSFALEEWIREHCGIGTAAYDVFEQIEKEKKEALL